MRLAGLAGDVRDGVLKVEVRELQGWELRGKFCGMRIGMGGGKGGEFRD